MPWKGELSDAPSNRGTLTRCWFGVTRALKGKKKPFVLKDTDTKTRREKSKCGGVQLFITFPPNSQLTYSFQIFDLTLTYSTFEKRKFMDICESRRNVSSGRMHFPTYLNRLGHKCKQSQIILTVFFFFIFTSF